VGGATAIHGVRGDIGHVELRLPEGGAVVFVHEGEAAAAG
jgi:hypothetical protein